MTSRTVLLAGTCLLFACGERTYPPEPAFLNGTSDEAWRALVDADADGKTATDDSRAAVLTAPPAGSQLAAADPPPTFRWRQPIAAALPPRAPRQRWTPWLLAGGVAWAHGEAFTGDATWVRLVRRSDGADLAAAFTTTASSWTPTAAQWNAVRAAGGAIEVRLLRAIVRENEVTEGPYRAGTTPELTVAP